MVRPAPRLPTEASLWRDENAEDFFNLPRGTMRRVRATGHPPELADIPFLKLGHLVRYEPEVCRAALAKLRTVRGKPCPVEPEKPDAGS